MSIAQIIHPSKIESELERIWDSLQGLNKMRASLFNLIFYTKKNPRCNYLHEVAQKVIQKFPARILFITVDPESKGVQASVSVMTASEGKSAIICDLINLNVGLHDQEKIPFLVLPHLIPDLPVYLIYADDPTLSNPLTSQFETFVMRTIFDSETTLDLSSFAQSILKYRSSSKNDIADLNWGRIEGWRELLANTFHNQELLSAIQQLKKVTLTYNALETASLCHTKTQAIYLQGWLSCQLGWQLQRLDKKNTSLIFHYTKNRTDIEVELIAHQMPALSPGRIIKLEIQTEKDHFFSFKRSPQNPQHISIERSTPEICFIPSSFIFEKDESGQSLVKEICHQGTSAHYLALMTYLSKIDSELLCS